MRDVLRRLAAMETREAAKPKPPRPLTADDWIALALLDAVIVAYWLGDPDLEPWERLYSGISSGNKSADKASALRYPLRDRLEWAAHFDAGHAATGVMNTRRTVAYRRIPDAARSDLGEQLASLPQRHPDVVGPGPVGSGRDYIWVTDAGGLRDAAGQPVEGLPLSAFGIEAGMAALVQQKIDLENWRMRRA